MPTMMNKIKQELKEAKKDMEEVVKEVKKEAKGYCPKENAKKAESIPQIGWQEALKEHATGDIIMHHGTGTNSRNMQKAMGCYYSHTAMLLRSPPKDILQLYKVEDCPSDTYVWEVTAQVKGTRIVPWLKWIAAETERNGDKYIYVWRHLTGISSQAQATIYTEVRNLESLEYEKSQMQMIKALVHANDNDDMSSAFCSEGVAHIYKKAGLLPSAVITSNQTTADFSHYYSNADLGDQLQQGSLAPEVRVNVKNIQWPPA
uniref:Uncharacterized protein n=1 Tax=Eutreptiella gymnastica TaxID=73025 RepID=A0A7S1N4I1_9EUGL|mmetsp:Transcript_118868/g.207064  ORF Transcript_118868/g.207064 Transcript_118868/m.207064 type:complete len:260 (+) Transcript_118868:28-807(+)